MAARLDALGDDDVGTALHGALRLLGTAHLHHHGDGGGVATLDERRRITPEEREDGHSLLQTNVKLRLRSLRRGDGRNEVHPKWAIGKCPRLPDLLADEIGRHPEHAQHPEGARVRDGGNQLGPGHAGHAGLDHGVDNAQPLRGDRGEHDSSLDGSSGLASVRIGSRRAR